MESIQGLVEHIVYHNDTNGYTVFSLMCQGEEIVCVGNVTSLDEGEYLKAEGEYTEHQVYGRQFKVTSMSVEVPEDEYSIERYLGSGAIRGVGPSLAARIVKKFKKDSFRIIEEEPERLAEIKGISERKAREIYQQFHEKQDMRQAMMFLAKYGITTTLSLRIYKQYGEEMYRIIQENPYRLADDMNGIGFKLADEIAKRPGLVPIQIFESAAALSICCSRELFPGIFTYRRHCWWRRRPRCWGWKKKLWTICFRACRWTARLL